MWALAPDIAERLGVEAVNLDPEHVEVFNRSQDLQIPLGLGVEIEIEQDIDVGTRPLADRLQMHAQVTQHLAFDVDLGLKGRAETGPPAGWFAAVIGENIGLQRGEFLLADLASDRLHAVETFDRRRVPGGMIDTPGRAVRPVDANAIAN